MSEDPITALDQYVGEPVRTEVRCATLTIHRAGEMTPEGRKKIAEWLRYHAKMIVEEGDNYAPRFTGRYTAVPAGQRPN